MKCLLLYLLLLLPCFCHAATPPSDSTGTRRIGLLLHPVLGHTPETRWYGGASTLLTLRLPSDSLTRTSSLRAEANFTQNRQFILSAGWNIFTNQEKYSITGELAYLRFPENFYGIGNNTTEQFKENYSSKRIEFTTALLRRISRYWYVGPRYQLQHIYDVSSAPGGLLASGLVPGGEGGLSSGVGVATAYDTRQNLLNPQQGLYAAASVTAFGKATGSDFSFVRYQLDLRKYFRLPWQHLLALQAYSVFNSGNPPFRMLGLLGSSSHMRGYYLGRFRERQYLSCQAEYRLQLFRRLGATAFAGAGDVAYLPRQFQLQEFKPSYGLGLRFKINRKENINLRLDYARGHNTSGFYIAVGEAF